MVKTRHPSGWVSLYTMEVLPDSRVVLSHFWIPMNSERDCSSEEYWPTLFIFVFLTPVLSSWLDSSLKHFFVDMAVDFKEDISNHSVAKRGTDPQPQRP